MKSLKIVLFLLALVFVFGACTPSDSPIETSASDPVTEPETDAPASGVAFTDSELRDRLEGSWLGQMIGVTWSAVTEFRYTGVIIPEREVPAWKPSLINDAFGQDDLYVEIPFIDAMKDNGVDCSLQTLADYFRDSTFGLAHANLIGRDNLRKGLSPADAGHYLNNYHADDIDWQIECDFLGNIYAGLINESAARAFEIGHIMNYGDGVYGGVFITAMHAASFTCNSIEEIIAAGISTIPEGTDFRGVIDDVMQCYSDDMSWEECWQFIEDKWADTDKCCEFGPSTGNIDAKLNSAYVLIGLLYGDGDMEDTIVISMRCGQDSDCNPSSAAAILGGLIGRSGIESEYLSDCDFDGAKFSYTDYTLADAIDINFDLMKEALTAAGCKTDSGWLLPAKEEITPVPFEQWPDDELCIYASARVNSEQRVTLSSSYVYGKSNDVSLTWDMGNGVVLPFNLTEYRYPEPGKYTITVTATAGDGAKATRTFDVEVTPATNFVKTPICSENNPAGGGSRSLSVLTDGIPGSSNDSQYDTFTGRVSDAAQYFGLTFNCTVGIKSIIFTEGNHFENGGWFKEIPSVQLLINGTWTDAASTVSPAYPNADNLGAHGAGFQTYEFTLTAGETSCTGIRLIAAGGGSQAFISCSELTVTFGSCELTDSPTLTLEQRSTAFCSVLTTAGAGSHSLSVISDGKVVRQNGMQYDTFTGTTEAVETFIGYIFDSAYTVSGVTFTEGEHFDNGGWFSDGSLKLQLFIDKEWKDVEYSVSPNYPDSNKRSDFGQGYQEYTFTLNTPSQATGIRLIGMPGGANAFISCSELAVELAG